MVELHAECKRRICHEVLQDEFLAFLVLNQRRLLQVPDTLRNPLIQENTSDHVRDLLSISFLLLT